MRNIIELIALGIYPLYQVIDLVRADFRRKHRDQTADKERRDPGDSRGNEYGSLVFFPKRNDDSRTLTADLAFIGEFLMNHFQVLFHLGCLAVLGELFQKLR